jgi:lipopolysaccharide export system ATP-binding protein
VFDFLFGGQSRRKRKPASGFWRIDLGSLGGPITALARVTLNLPQRSQKAPQKLPQKAPQKSPKPQRDGRHADPPRPLPGQPAPDELHERSQHDYRQPPFAQPHARPQQQREYQQPSHPPPRDRAEHDYQRASLAPHDRPQQHNQQPSSQAAHGDAFLAVHGVEKSFGKRKVVKGVSLYVRRGEAVGLLGPNGAGKTTVFYMITGLIKADRGRVDLDGFNISGLPMYQRARLGIGYLPQEASIFRGLTVEDNIRSVLEIVEPNRKRREADLNDLLDEFNITRLRKTPSIALSGGERRRVEIARALASRPNYMLLDEPFAGIDPIAVGDIQALVRHLTQRGIGVLITDHNVRETLGLTDRAYIIYSGQVLMEGRTEDIVNDPEVRRLYLGEEFRL